MVAEESTFLMVRCISINEVYLSEKSNVRSLSEAACSDRYIQSRLHAQRGCQMESKPTHRNCEFRYELLHI